MTVMLCGLIEIRMAMSLLEMGMQLMILPTASFHTIGCVECPERDSTFDLRQQHPSGWTGALLFIQHTTLPHHALRLFSATLC